MKPTLEPISLAESKRLNELEAVIKRNEGAMLETAEALTEIRDNRLYRAEYGTFKAYCEERLGICRARGYQLINFAETVKMSTTVDKSVSTTVDTPKNEHQARKMRAAAKVPLSDASEPTSRYCTPEEDNAAEAAATHPALRGVDVSKLDDAPPVKLTPQETELMDALEAADADIKYLMDCIAGHSCDVDACGAAASNFRKLAALVIKYQKDL